MTMVVKVKDQSKNKNKAAHRPWSHWAGSARDGRIARMGGLCGVGRRTSPEELGLMSFHQIATTTLLHLVINALRPTDFCNIILYQLPLSRSSRIDSLLDACTPRSPRSLIPTCTPAKRCRTNYSTSAFSQLTPTNSSPRQRKTIFDHGE